MAAEVSFGLSESETELVDQLCAQFDPEQFIPQWMRERGSEADWQAYLRVERHEFRDEVEVAALVGSMINRPLDGQRGKTWVVEADTVLQLFYGLAEDLTRMTTSMTSNPDSASRSTSASKRTTTWSSAAAAWRSTRTAQT